MCRQRGVQDERRIRRQRRRGVETCRLILIQLDLIDLNFINWILLIGLIFLC